MFVRSGNKRELETWEEVRMVEKEISWPGGPADLKKSGRELETREGFEAKKFGNNKHAYQA